ncbi:MAG: hypothetical protein GC147_02395 [Porphyrobacter sp.]|nr:hypothetical protein [Porphyrobacter sp.]
MTSVPSSLSLAAASLYGAVAMCSLVAAGVAILRKQQGWHVSGWLLLAVLFVFLAVLRVYGVEEAIRHDLRSVLYHEGVYGERRTFQRPVAAIAVALISLGAAAWIYIGFRNVVGRRNVAMLIGFASAYCMIGLLGLRLISLSPVDKLLFGPAKLNWFIDIGSSLAVFASAAYYSWLVGWRRRKSA